MKTIGLAMLMVMGGAAQAANEPQCTSAVAVTAGFMAATYSVRPSDIKIQVLSVKKETQDKQVLVDVLSSVPGHKCALKVEGLDFGADSCKWGISTVSCDGPNVPKGEVVDEPSWANEKVSLENFKDALRNTFLPEPTPALVDESSE